MRGEVNLILPPSSQEIDPDIFSCSAGDLEPDVGSKVKRRDGEDYSEHGTDKVGDIESGER